jgi:hypothetical protein
VHKPNIYKEDKAPNSGQSNKTHKPKVTQSRTPVVVNRCPISTNAREYIPRP